MKSKQLLDDAAFKLWLDTYINNTNLKIQDKYKILEKKDTDLIRLVGVIQDYCCRVMSLDVDKLDSQDVIDVFLWIAKTLHNCCKLREDVRKYLCEQPSEPEGKKDS